MAITPTPMEAGLIERPEKALNVGLDGLKVRLALRRPNATPLLSDEALSRESIYTDRGDIG